MLGVQKMKMLLGVAVIGLGVTASSAVADSLGTTDPVGNLDTFQGATSGWTVTRAGSTTDVQQVTQAFPLNAWIQGSQVNDNQFHGQQPTTPAVWVSTDNAGGGGSDVNGQQYVFKDNFSVHGDGVATHGYLVLSGTISTDNWIPTDGITLSYVEGGHAYSTNIVVPAGVSGNETNYSADFQVALDLGNAVSLPHDFTLSVDVVNSYGVGSAGFQNGTPPGPVGLILAGSAYASSVAPAGTNAQVGQLVPVPLPTAARGGFATLSFIGIVGFLRKRFLRRARVV